jgi:hypothetical protein
MLYKHKKTGAEVMSLRNTDENKTFGVVLRTPPANSTGIPHILEHSVLCGSRKYPIKEPFVELMKGSLNTFLNAFTYPDRTCYPVASTNLQVGYNSAECLLFFFSCISLPHMLRVQYIRAASMHDVMQFWFGLYIDRRPLIPTSAFSFFPSPSPLYRISTTWWTCTWTPCSSPSACRTR